MTPDGSRVGQLGLIHSIGVNDDAVHLVYELNGGVNHNANPDVITAEELPFALEIPVRDGYNFAGWYTDSSYDHKITEITEENAANMVLFAKWTRPIDNRYNVEMYSYQTASVLSRNQKELKECNYAFLDGAGHSGNAVHQRERLSRQSDQQRGTVSARDSASHRIIFL